MAENANRAQSEPSAKSQQLIRWKLEPVNRSSSWIAVLPSLVIPVCLGLTMYLGMSVMLEREVITNETVVRYVAGHPVSKLTVAMFFIGLGSLALISLNVFTQFRWTKRITIKPPADTNNNTANHATVEEFKTTDVQQDADKETTDGPITPDLEQAATFAGRLLKYPKHLREHYLWGRLHEALHFIHRTGSSSGIEDELKYLGDLDNDHQQQRYSLVRILIWATPMLGFLGTVLGISQALGGINVGADNDFQQMLGSLRGSLYIAFDTTALALILSMVLMFGQFFVDRFESQLLRLVDYCTRRELSTHFVMSSTGDQTLESVRELGRTVLAANHDLVRKQTDIWRQSISSAEKAWVESLTGANDHVSDNLTSALDNSVENLASYLGQAIQRADDSMVGRLEQWQVSLSENARNMRDHQGELTRHTTLISSLLDKMGTVGDFHSALATNKDALAATGYLQETLEQLVETVKTASVKEPFIRIISNTIDPETHTIELRERDVESVQTNLSESPAPDPAESADEQIDDDTVVSIPFDQATIADTDYELESMEEAEFEPEPVDILESIFAIAGELGPEPTDSKPETVSPEIHGPEIHSPSIPFPTARYLAAERESGARPSLSFPVLINEYSSDENSSIISMEEKRNEVAASEKSAAAKKKAA